MGPYDALQHAQSIVPANGPDVGRPDVNYIAALLHALGLIGGAPQPNTPMSTRPASIGPAQPTPLQGMRLPYVPNPPGPLTGNAPAPMSALSNGATPRNPMSTVQGEGMPAPRPNPLQSAIAKRSTNAFVGPTQDQGPSELQALDMNSMPGFNPTMQPAGLPSQAMNGMGMMPAGQSPMAGSQIANAMHQGQQGPVDLVTLIKHLFHRG